MDMTGERRIPAPRQRVWEALNDPEVLRACIPGCETMEFTGENQLKATASLKIGPISAKFGGKVTLSEIDPPNGYTITGEGAGGVAGFAKGGAKVALLEARVAEVALQRTQLEDLIQSLSRSRDENLLIDVEAAVRVALQQTAITGSAEPLVAALKQSGERLERHQEPRLEGVRRAVVRDLDRIKAVSVTDISSLAIKLDEAIRMVDDLTLLANAEPRPDFAAKTAATSKSTSSVPVGRSASSSGGVSALAALPGKAGEWWNSATGRIWTEVKSLVRVTRIDNPDAMLLAPEQSFFVRENLKLRLLNARLALLSRQFDTAQSDMLNAQAAVDRYFDRSSKRTAIVTDLIRQVAGQARQVGIPRPDDTLAALTAAGAGR